MSIATIIIFLLILGVIVFVHELGHFATAKFFGVKVEEFGLGFPPKIAGKKKGETEYTLNWIPLGGFVKIMGEDGENRDDPRSFGSKSVWQRAVILSAGVAMNFLLAAVLFSAVFMAGFPTDISDVDVNSLPAGTKTYVQIIDVVKDSPAQLAGIMGMDRILQVDGKNVQTIEDVQNYTKQDAGKNVALTIERQGGVIQKQVFVRESESGGQGGGMGVSLARTAVIHYSLLESIKEGFLYTGMMTAAIFEYLFHILGQLLYTGGTSAQLSGPVGMVSMTQQAAQLGLTVLLNFTALISVNLAIINILPLPALDGGRILFLLVEKIKGRPVSRELEAKIHNAGFIALMLLMLVVTFQDIARLGIWNKLAGII